MTSAPSTVYLHIGAMKTGTTYLQTILRTNPATRSSDGICFPMVQGQALQNAATRDVLQLRNWDQRSDQIPGAWDRLRDEIRRSQSRSAVISMEFLSFASADQAREVVSSLRPAEVHVILGVRDTTRVLPARWQTYVRNGGQTAWPDFCADVMTRDRSSSATRRHAMRALAIPRFLEHWAPTVPPDHLHVIVTPRAGSGPDLLWRRFASVIGASADAYALPGKDVNPSLGYASADLLRRLNRRLRDLDDTTRGRLVSRLLGRRILPGRTGDRPIPLTTELLAFAHEWNTTIAEAVRSSRAQVVGDLAELDNPTGEAATSLDKPNRQELLDAAAWAAEGLRGWLGPAPVGSGVDSSAEAWSSADRPVATAVAAVESLLREVLARRGLEAIS